MIESAVTGHVEQFYTRPALLWPINPLIRVLIHPFIILIDGRFAAEDVVETVADGEDSEEEWNYYQGDEKRPPSSQLNNSDVIFYTSFFTI